MLALTSLAHHKYCLSVFIINMLRRLIISKLKKRPNYSTEINGDKSHLVFLKKMANHYYFINQTSIIPIKNTFSKTL